MTLCFRLFTYGISIERITCGVRGIDVVVGKMNVRKTLGTNFQVEIVRHISSPFQKWHEKGATFRLLLKKYMNFITSLYST